VKYGVVDDKGDLHYGLSQGDAENLASQTGWALVLILPAEDMPELTYTVSYYSDSGYVTKHFAEAEEAVAFYERVASDSWKSSARLVQATVLRKGVVR
jgi:hypothetical protein